MRRLARIRYVEPAGSSLSHFDTLSTPGYTASNTMHYHKECSLMNMRTTKVLNVSMPPEMYEEVTRVAREEQRTKSELIREAFRQYQFNRRWRLLRRWGDETAALMGIESDEDIERLAG